MDVTLKLVQSIFTALIVIVVFGRVNLFLFRLIIQVFKMCEGWASSWCLRMRLEEYKELLPLFRWKGQFLSDKDIAKHIQVSLTSLRELSAISLSN